MFSESQKSDSSPGLEVGAESARPSRKKMSKRRFIEEVWEVQRPLKRPKKELSTDPPPTLTTATTTTTTTSTTTTATASSPTTKPMPCLTEVKKLGLKVDLERLPLGNDPLRRALIEVSRIHPVGDSKLSNIEASVEKLVIEHLQDCDKCQQTDQIIDILKDLDGYEHNSETPKVTVTEVLNSRIQQLKQQMKRLQESYDKLVETQKSEVTYQELLGSVAKPALFKENNNFVFVTILNLNSF